MKTKEILICYILSSSLLHHLLFLFVKDGYTPLHIAADRGRKAIVQILLDNDADFMAVEKVSKHIASLASTISIVFSLNIYVLT